MKWLDKAIGTIAPTWGLKRMAARSRLERLSGLQKSRRSFESVSGNRIRHDFLTDSKSIDGSALASAESLRKHVRQLEQNNGDVAGPIKRIASNVVGTGIKFQSRCKADEKRSLSIPSISQAGAERFNVEAEFWYRKWVKQADKRLLLNFHEIQSVVQKALVRDGAALIIGRDSARRDRHIPYCLEILEIDRLQTPMSEANNQKIRGGVKYDAEGVPEFYLVLKHHPGDSFMPVRDQDYEEIPAYNRDGTQKVFHLFDAVRPEQSHGFSEFAPGLANYQDFDRYAEAEIMAALEDACMVGVIKSNNPEGWQSGRTSGNVETGNEDGSTRRMHDFAPGEMWYLENGEEADIHKPNRPNDAFAPFLFELLRGPANALDMPPEVLRQDWKGFNYSNARTVLLQWYLSCRIRQRYLIDHLCDPVYACVIRQLIARGLVRAPAFDQRMDAYMQTAWVAPGWQWVDPVKEVEGKRIEMENQMETLANIAAAKGDDWEDTLEQRARELKKMKELEAKHGIEFKTEKKPAHSVGRPAKDDDEEAAA